MAKGPHEIRRAAPDESKVADEVAPPEASGLATKTKQPFQPSLLHPLRRLGLVSCQEIEGGADRDEHCSNLRSESVNEFILLRSTEAYPHHIRPTLGDSGSKQLLLGSS